MNEDAELLREFVEEHAEAAFRELVRRRIDFVYAAALRQVGGDAHLAEEVASGVFLDLARKARVLAGRTTLAGWLYTSTRFAAAKALRARARRWNHETEAQTMHEIMSAGSEVEPNWNELRPVIDAAMHELGERDREAILLRYFEGRSFAEVGGTCGLNENSARMRVERALEKLRGRLAQRGITSTAAALGMVLAAQPAVAAPAGLAAAVAGPALAGAAAGGALLPFAGFMSTTKITLGAIGLAAVLGTGAYLGGRYQSAAILAEREAELATLRLKNETLATAPKQARAVPPAGASAGQPAVRRLVDVAADVARARAEREARGGAGGGGRGGLSTGPLPPIPAGPVAPASLETLRMLADLQARRLVTTGMSFVNMNGKLSASFTELFALSGGEQAALQQSVDQARDRLAEFERANATLTRDEKGGVVITVNSFAEAGGVVYDGLMKAFADTLGPERNAAFVALGATQVERALGQAGTAQRTVTFSFDATAPAAGRYSVNVRHKLPNESGSSSSSFGSLSEARDYAGTVGRLVPSDFGR